MNPPRQPGRSFRLVLAALPSEVPVEVRLRSALKVLLRAFGLKAAEMPEELPADGPQGGEAAAKPARE